MDMVSKTKHSNRNRQKVEIGSKINCYKVILYFMYSINKYKRRRPAPVITTGIHLFP
jgi:hypothetical protein